VGYGPDKASVYRFAMIRYFFDTRDDDQLITDDVGLQCRDLEMVKVQATTSLAELARDILPGSARRHLRVDVRDQDGRPVMILELTFEARIRLADAP
jgi:hypothetical protein